MRNRTRIIGAFCALGFIGIMISNLFSVEVKKIDIRRFEDFQQGKLSGSSIDNKGRVGIGPDVKIISGPPSEYYLSMGMAANGDVYVGTGHKGSVYRVKPGSVAAPADAQGKGGNFEEIFTSDALDIFAMIVKANGDVYVGTSPEGKIYKISANDKEKGGKEFFNPEEKFIWDLKEDKEGNIICATGNEGCIYRITPDGQATKIFSPDDTHITSLFISSNNSIFAGSGDRGILYRIENRKAKVLYDSPFEEIMGICEDKSGNIFFTASKGLSAQDMHKRSSDSSSSGKSKKEDDKEERVSEKSALYCLRTDGVVEMIWKSDTEHVYSAVYDAKNDAVIMGTGDSGRVYRVKKDGSFSIIYESESAQIFKIVPTNKGSFGVITNNTASIAEIGVGINSKATYFSDVYDLQVQSKLGRLYWEAEKTAQSDVQLFVRSGNSKSPDSTWTDWSAPFTDSENSAVNVSDCRYFQIKAILNSKNGIDTPYINSIKMYYLQANLGPVVKKIDIQRSFPKPAIVTLTGQTPQLPTPEKKSKSLFITWSASDPNSDKLKYNVSMRKVSSTQWIPLKEDLTENKWELDMELFQDGKYVLKVDADDSLANPPASMKTNSLVSFPFLVDSTAPVIGNFSAAGNRVRFNVTDQTSIISHVFYSFDGKLWFPVFPTDGMNDSKTEAFDVEVKNPGGKKVMFIKAMDEYENTSVFQAEL